jgi:GT2 family glycosyltransferase
VTGEGVTVVVPTLDRAEMVVETVKGLLDQEHSPLEILVVDQSERPNTVLGDLERLRPETVTYRHVSFRGLPVARNFGWMKARHKAVVYVDDDVEVAPGFVEAHLGALSLDGVGMVGGRISEAGGVIEARKPASRTGGFNPVLAVANRGFDVDGLFEDDHVPGGNFSAWHHVLDRSGGFDERLGDGAALLEETDLCLRAKKEGHRICFSGAASLIHLRVEAGGCRVPDVSDYVHSLARNRSVVIRRHLQPVFWLIALGRSYLYGLSYATAYRRPSALMSCLRGSAEGWRLGALEPLCTGGKASSE